MLVFLLFFTAWATADLLTPSLLLQLWGDGSVESNIRRWKRDKEQPSRYRLVSTVHAYTCVCVQSQVFGGEGNKARLGSGLLEGGTKINTLFIMAFQPVWTLQDLKWTARKKYHKDNRSLAVRLTPLYLITLIFKVTPQYSHKYIYMYTWRNHTN